MAEEVELADLWRRGRELVVDGPEGSRTVWLQKLNIGDQEEAFRRARAKRATVLVSCRDKESDDFKVKLADAYAIGDVADTVEFLINVDFAHNQRRAKIEAQLAAEEEWSKDGYLRGLHDAWEGGLKDRFAADGDDAEAQRVFAEMGRFDAEVREEVTRVRAELAAEWEGVSEEQVYEKAAEALAAAAADAAFNDEYWKCEVWKGTRHAANHDLLVHQSRAEVQTLMPDTYDALRAGFVALEVDVLTGKDSPAPPASSTLSDAPEEAATPESSGLVGATA